MVQCLFWSRIDLLNSFISPCLALVTSGRALNVLAKVEYVQIGVLLKYCYLVSISWKLINLCVVKCALLNLVNITKARRPVFPKVYIMYASKTNCV